MISTKLPLLHVFKEKLSVFFTSNLDKSPSKQIDMLNPIFSDTTCLYGSF